MRELGLESGVDTLGRWMAHHVAALIDEAENATTPVERSRARKDAAETILRIWEHRASLPGKAYPLSEYKDVLETLDRLRPSSNPFLRFQYRDDATRELLAASLFDGLSRLVVALLLVMVPSCERTEEVDAAATEALTETEQQVLARLQEWTPLIMSADTVAEEAVDSESDTETDLHSVALQLIDSVTATLGELRSELGGADRHQAED